MTQNVYDNYSHKSYDWAINDQFMYFETRWEHASNHPVYYSSEISYITLLNESWNNSFF